MNQRENKSYNTVSKGDYMKKLIIYLTSGIIILLLASLVLFDFNTDKKGTAR